MRYRVTVVGSALLISFGMLGISLAAQEAGQTSSREAASQLPTIEELRQTYAQRHDEEVIVLADRALHEITMKGDLDQRAGELHFWRGASLRRLGRDKEALIAFEESKARGFNTPELHLEMALVKRSQGDTEGAQSNYQAAERVLPSDLEKQERLIDRWNREGKDEPRFKLTLSPQAGYDSNIIGLDPNTPLLQGNTNADSAYLGAYLDARWFALRNNHQTLEIDYQGLFREYPDSSDLGFIDNLITALGRQPLGELADLEARASLEEAFMKSDGHFRTLRTIGTGLLLYPLSSLQMHLYGDWSSATYYDSTPPEQDRDGDIYRIGLEAAMNIGRGWTMGPYVVVNKYNAQGSDYDSHGWEVGFTIRPEEFLWCRVSATLDVSEQYYTNDNSVTSFTEKRTDRPIQLTLAIVFKQIERIIGYAPSLSITYANHYSNIQEFKYTRWSPQIEMGLSVLSF